MAADCGRNFVHGLCTGRYGSDFITPCHRCKTGLTPWVSRGRPEGQGIKAVPWREKLQALRLDAVQACSMGQQGALASLVSPLKTGKASFSAVVATALQAGGENASSSGGSSCTAGGSGEEREIPINTSLPVQNAQNVAAAINHRLSCIPASITRVSIAPRTPGPGLVSVQLARRGYRGEVVWAVAGREAPALWEMIGVNPHRPLPDPPPARALPGPSTPSIVAHPTPPPSSVKAAEIIDLCSSDSDEEGEVSRALPYRVAAGLAVAAS